MGIVKNLNFNIVGPENSLRISIFNPLQKMWFANKTMKSTDLTVCLVFFDFLLCHVCHDLFLTVPVDDSALPTAVFQETFASLWLHSSVVGSR